MSHKLYRSFTLLILTIYLLTTQGSTVLANNSNAQDKLDTIDSLVTTTLKTSKMPGVSVAVIDGDQIDYFSHGYADMDNKTPMSNDTLFRIGSVTKSYTALAILLLEEQNKISLDDPITKYLPWLNLTYDGKQVADSLTLANFLNQTSGFTNDEALYHIPADAGNSGLEETIRCLNNSALSFMPSSQYAYSNINFCILGLVIETVSKVSYEVFMKDNILGPLGLQHTYVNPLEISPDETIAAGYKLSWLRPSKLEDDIIKAKIPSGYLTASITDLAKWANVHLNPEQVKPDFAKIINKSHLPDLSVDAVGKNHYGSGWFIDESTKRVWHSGGTINFSAFVAMDHKNSRAVCVLANTNSAADVQYIADNILNILDDKPVTMYGHDILYIFDFIFIIITAVTGLASILLLLLLISIITGIKSQTRIKSPLTVKKIVLIALPLLLWLGIIIFAIIFPSFFQATWKEIISWLSPSIVAGFSTMFIASTLLTILIYIAMRCPKKRTSL